MLRPEQIIDIVGQVARANLTAGDIDQVLAEATTDSEGDEALRITIVVRSGSEARLDGDAILDTLVQLQQRLREAGEDRLPIVDYATDEELENSGSSQP